MQNILLKVTFLDSRGRNKKTIDAAGEKMSVSALSLTFQAVEAATE